MKRKRKKKKGFPRSITVGNATVKIYRVKNGQYKSFQVADFTTGKRVLHSFGELSAAEKKANDLAKQLNNGDVNATTLTNEDKAIYHRALQYLAPSKTPLDFAALQFAECMKILQGRSPVEAARFYAKAHPQDIPTKLVVEVVNELIADAETRGLSERYIESLRHYLHKFADKHGIPISSVVAADVRQFLNDLDLAPRSRNNFLDSIRTLFKFAAERDYLPLGFNQIDRVKSAPETGGKIEVYAPEELRRLLTAAALDFVPCLAIGAFAGLRSAEIERLDWRDIKLEAGVILVRARASNGERNKTGKRTAPLLPVLKNWLTPYAKSEGPVWEEGHDRFYHELRETAAATETKELPALGWKHNALRHSFISYRVQQIQNLPQVALEAGNSPQVINKNYREVELPDGRLITSKEAEAWFSVMPAKVIPMPPSNAVAADAAATA